MEKPPGETDKARRDAWLRALGYSKKSKDGLLRGEQRIEAQLFKSPLRLVRNGTPALNLTVSYHNFPLTNSSKGQVLCDALGFLEHRRKYHPLAIEVKVSDQDPWYAVVENLIQVRLARFNLRKIEAWAIREGLADKRVKEARGAWGLVVAPQAYYEKKPKHLAAALELITELHRQTRARIILANSDHLADGYLEWIRGSYWPANLKGKYDRSTSL